MLNPHEILYGCSLGDFWWVILPLFFNLPFPQEWKKTPSHFPISRMMKVAVKFSMRVTWQPTMKLCFYFRSPKFRIKNKSPKYGKRKKKTSEITNRVKEKKTFFLMWARIQGGNFFVQPKTAQKRVFFKLARVRISKLFF